MPSVTMQPAILPTLGTLKISRISAWPRIDSLRFRLEHAREQALHLVQELVNDRVVADLDPVAPRHLARLGVGPDVEAQDRRLRRRSQGDVGLGDGADAAEQDADLDLVGADPLEAGGECLERALHVGLDHHRQLALAAEPELGEHVLQRAARTGGRDMRLIAPLALPVLGDLAGPLLAVDHGK